jgi:hypothetical protein
MFAGFKFHFKMFGMMCSQGCQAGSLPIEVLLPALSAASLRPSQLIVPLLVAHLSGCWWPLASPCCSVHACSWHASQFHCGGSHH